MSRKVRAKRPKAAARPARQRSDEDHPALAMEVEALRERERHFRELFEHVPIGIYRTTPEGKFLMANPALVRLMGFSSYEELAARDLEGSPYAPDYTRAEFKERMGRDGEIRGLESTWKRLDGTTFKVRENARLVRDESGAILYYEGSVEDITEKKRAEEELKEKSDFLEEVITNVSVGIFVLDEEGTYVLINPECGKLVGHWPDDWTGKTSGLHVHPEDQGKGLSHFIQALSGEPNDVDLRIQASDGTYKLLHVHLFPLNLMGKSHVLGMVTELSGDISEGETNQKGAGRLYSSVMVLLSMMDPKVLSSDSNALAVMFTDKVEKHFRHFFEDDMARLSQARKDNGKGGAPGPGYLLDTYLMWLTSLFNKLGNQIIVSRDGPGIVVDVQGCNWLDEARANPLVCQICGAMVCRTFSWTGLDGTGELLSRITAGAKTCRFEFRLRGRPACEAGAAQ